MTIAVSDNDVIRIEKSMTNLVMLCAGSFVMACVSLILALGWLPSVDQTNFVQRLSFVGWIGVVFFGLCTGMIIRTAFFGPKTVLTIAPTGLHDTRLSQNEIPWNAVQSVTTWEQSKQKLVVLSILPDAEAQLRLTRMVNMTRKANARLGVDGLCVSNVGLKTTFDQLLQFITNYFSQYGSVTSERRV
ncbi:STM3941 family protein [Parasulfitobacter algicola]|uniref:Uncharacterized protein n=1 Tax=Parasulfitobacter algicola TaxID=2614809 RepID=A0ABX2IVK0_9RHOB|nr:STM3941 family protein [Sulfitobacter algicola]NSX55060.1 hypothetical protein [Sulfitobacter algicola]